MAIWFTSDFHFWHNKDFIYKERGFPSIEEMNENLLSNFNSLVKNDDNVYILGDLCLGGSDCAEANMRLLNSLPGRIHLVRGNHDTWFRWQMYQEQCTWDLVEASNAIYLDYKKYHFYLSHFPTMTSNQDYDKPLKQRLLNLCGHTHTKDKWGDFDKGYIYHVEVDAHNLFPVNIDTIIQDFNDMHSKENNKDRYVYIDPKEQSKNIQQQRIICGRCVWSGICPGFNIYSHPIHCPSGWTYKRDPPDGGYYG